MGAVFAPNDEAVTSGATIGAEKHTKRRCKIVTHKKKGGGEFFSPSYQKVTFVSPFFCSLLLPGFRAGIRGDVE